jgi:[ribosomal protein S5]-alanine N-acetyltransferase
MIELHAPDWWQQLPVLSGPTVQLREVAEHDVNALLELLADPEVSRYISPSPSSAVVFQGFVEWVRCQRQAGACVCFVVIPKGLTQAIGLFQLRALDQRFETAEWGFAIGAAFWGTGLFQEAATLVAEFAFREIGVHRLEARSVTENKRGNRVLEKLGARGEAILNKAFDREHTQFLWAILADEWKPVPAPRLTPFDAAKLKRQIQVAIARTPFPARQPRLPVAPFRFFLIP